MGLSATRFQFLEVQRDILDRWFREHAPSELTDKTLAEDAVRLLDELMTLRNLTSVNAAPEAMEPASLEAATSYVAALNQIDRLAGFIMEAFPGEPSQDEGAVDCAIRLLRQARPAGLMTKAPPPNAPDELGADLLPGETE